MTDWLPKNSFSNINFTATIEKPLHQLIGFDKSKGKNPLSSKGAYADEFIFKAANETINSFIGEITTNTKSVMNLKRKQFSVTESDYDGYAEFNCDFFDVQISIAQSSDDFNIVTFTFNLTPKITSDILNFSEQLDQCIPFWFDFMDCPAGTSEFNLEEIIDNIEDNDKLSEDLNLDYNSDLSKVDITHKETRREFIFTKKNIRIHFNGSEKLNDMLTSLQVFAEKPLQIN